MRLSEILKEEKKRCITCDGLGKEIVGDSQLMFDCPDCKGTGYWDDKEELEEIKVTKTVAGKRASASQTLAGKLKKKMPNQGKKPVELDKMKDAKELANNLLKGQYKS